MYAKNIENEKTVNLKFERFIRYLYLLSLILLLRGGDIMLFFPDSI